MTTGRVIRALVGLFVLIVLLVMVNGWWNEYKNATPKRDASEATSTADATQTAPAVAVGPAVSVLTDGLNFREKPDATGASIRGLKKGETLVLVNQSGTWIEVADASGRRGWVNNNPQYLRIEKK